MFRYVAFVWNDAGPAARATAQRLAGTLEAEWQAALKQPGLAVFYSGARAGSSEPYTLHGGAGVVLGKLFVGSAAVPLEIDATETASILKTGGRHLVDRYWGRYVAFLRDAATDTTWVLRDPTAVLPCHVVTVEGVDVYFSWMEDAVRLGLGQFSVDSKYIAAALCYMQLQIPATALEGVQQVLGGECVEWRQGRRTRSFYWNPLQVASSGVFEDAGQAADALRECARTCVQAWASCYSGIVHTLSGGLDSSIVMACLVGAPSRPRITCVNYHSPDADGDERNFARLAARRAGHELIERPRNPEVSFEPLLSMHRSAVPPFTVLYYLENSRAEAQFAAERGATAIFSGNTGDQLFYQYYASPAAGDYLLRRGLTRSLFSVALDAARMDRVSVWKVLREAAGQRLLGRRWDPAEDVGKYRQLIPTDVVAAVQRDSAFVHPLLREPAGCLGAKLFHIYSLLFPPNLHTPMASLDEPELVAPLYSQPLIEVLLRTPVYLLVQNGWDRATARRAFQHEVPREIVTRQTKGGMEEHAKGIFLRNISLVRELLLDGFLVREGIIDAKKLREVLSGGPTRVASGTVELYDYFAAEAWIRRWRDAQPQRAAA